MPSELISSKQLKAMEDHLHHETKPNLARSSQFKLINGVRALQDKYEDMQDTRFMHDGELVQYDDDRLSRFFDALGGSNGGDQQRLAETALEWIDLLLRKNSDYGSSAWQVPALAPHLDVGAAILVRMSDKVARLGKLSGSPASVSDESFEDTLTDLGAYCLLYLARPKPDPQEEIAPGLRQTPAGGIQEAIQEVRDRSYKAPAFPPMD